MGNSLLFRWEDSQALKHHCGVCERPLQHPTARATCFGTHVEPCHRFHQVLFMRLRGHTCTYCSAIDEAHWKRHREVAQFLYHAYESCGQTEWSIIPSELEEHTGFRALDTTSDLPNQSLSKREKKDTKRLERASSRTRVITGEEIQYIDSVIHAAEGLSSNSTEGPRNIEEMKEIERHLRYNAHIYNDNMNRAELKGLTYLDHVDKVVDFDPEMKRILDTFRVNELTKRNSKNRGLQGRDLKFFQALAEEVRRVIVEDIIQVKKDVLETRMRRAGYLRYTNRSAYDIVEDRYIDKDWKTGEKLASGVSSFSDPPTPTQEHTTLKSASNENSAFLPKPAISVDLRHLESVHTRLDSDEDSGGELLDPYYTPLLPLLPDPAPKKKKPYSLKIVGVSKVGASNPDANFHVHTHRSNSYAPTLQPHGWKTVTCHKKPTLAAAKSVRTSSTSSYPTNANKSRHYDLGLHNAQPSNPSIVPVSINNLKAADPSVQAPVVAAKQPSSISKQAVAPLSERTNETSQSEAAASNLEISHPAVSQKKAKKASREAKRKAQKNAGASPEHISSGEHAEDLENADNTNEACSVAPILPSLDQAPGNICDSEHPMPSPALYESVHLASLSGSDVKVSPNPTFDVLPLAIPISQHGKHMNWTKFTRNFTVDRPTNPVMKTWPGCFDFDSSSCAFEGNEVVDCPFHKPHCSCADPMQDLCYIVHPGYPSFSCGPYNRLRGKKLLTQYENDIRTKGQLMLVDSDLLEFFLEDPSTRQDDRNMGMMPKRLADEYANVADGYTVGPLMDQESEFENRLANSQHLRHQISRKLLEELQRTRFERPGSTFMCYCNAYLPRVRDVANEVICSHRTCTTTYFHRSCVRGLGVGKVSRWFCTDCAKKMKTAAHMTLRRLGYDDIPWDPESFGSMADVDTLRKYLGMPDNLFNVLRNEISQFGANFKGVRVLPVPLRSPKSVERKLTKKDVE